MYFFIILEFFLLNLSIAANFNVFVDTSNPVRTISDPLRFLSVSLDMSTYPADENLNFTFIQPLAKALGPLHFRFGGTNAEFTIFQENTNQNTYQEKRATTILTG
uniref:Uncharacterized protein n=1 Tax=Acrobeloides nanus TaxID=290746 RepID=A0A914E0X6_9BILA